VEVIKALPLDPASIAVIEIGSGTGEALAPIAKSNCAAECLGIDYNPKFIE
jgi:tRNA G46 methylase TrmB